MTGTLALGAKKGSCMLEGKFYCIRIRTFSILHISVDFTLPNILFLSTAVQRIKNI